MLNYLKTWMSLRGDKRAVTMLEYGIIAALVAAVCVGTVTSFGTTINSKFQTIVGSL